MPSPSLEDLMKLSFVCSPGAGPGAIVYVPALSGWPRASRLLVIPLKQTLIFAVMLTLSYWSNALLMFIEIGLSEEA